MTSFAMIIQGHELDYADSETPIVRVTATETPDFRSNNIAFTVDPLTARDLQVGAKITVTVERVDADNV